MCIVVISNVISILMCIVVVIVIMIKSPEIVINTTLLQRPASGPGRRGGTIIAY